MTSTKLLTMAALEPFYFEPNMLQTPNMIAVKIVKWIIAWKNIFCWPCDRCQVSCRFFCLPPVSNRTEWHRINTAWLSSTVDVKLWAAFEMNFFRTIGFSEAETSQSGKAKYLLAVDEDEKESSLEWVSPSSCVDNCDVAAFMSSYFSLQFKFEMHLQYVFGLLPC